MRVCDKCGKELSRLVPKWEIIHYDLCLRCYNEATDVLRQWVNMGKSKK